jgi:hypothetical protein
MCSGVIQGAGCVLMKRLRLRKQRLRPASWRPPGSTTRHLLCQHSNSNYQGCLHSSSYSKGYCNQRGLDVACRRGTGSCTAGPAGMGGSLLDSIGRGDKVI